MANKDDRSLITLAGAAQTQIFLIVIIVALGCLASAAVLIAGYDLNSEQRWVFSILLTLFPLVGLSGSLFLILTKAEKLMLDESNTSWQPMTPEQQRRKLNLEVTTLANLLPSYQRSDLRSAYIIAEDLALRQIEIENRLPLMRHVVLEGVPFDGVAFKDERVFCVEVYFLFAPDVPQERIDALLDKVEYAAQRIRKEYAGVKVRLLLVLVIQLSQQDESQLRSTLSNKFALTPVDVDIRFLDFENLQKNFTAE